ncbi:hypothetical protein GQ44DRAFT_444943 [Phaeosphaeriaceae sp. PMI808]|nr:hypothetical protein GQ44DRAFT_444943 [Phaeosphaeriaceae sp. PMI808]
MRDTCMNLNNVRCSLSPISFPITTSGVATNYNSTKAPTVIPTANAPKVRLVLPAFFFFTICSYSGAVAPVTAGLSTEDALSCAADNTTLVPYSTCLLPTESWMGMRHHPHLALYSTFTALKSKTEHTLFKNTSLKSHFIPAAYGMPATEPLIPVITTLMTSISLSLNSCDRSFSYDNLNILLVSK